MFAVLAEAGTRDPAAAREPGAACPSRRCPPPSRSWRAPSLAAHSGTASSGTGRNAAVYRLGPAAGAVLAVDLGPALTRVRGCALDGSLLAEATGTRAEAADVVREALGALPADAPLRTIVVAVGDVTAPEGTGVRPATAKAGPVFDAVAVALPPGVPVHLENNVNCAALAELHEGAARGRHTFGYLRIGVGIGLGIVIGGQVLRGANGAAGEVARLPYPWDDGLEPRHEALEEHVGARSLLRRAADGLAGRRRAVPRHRRAALRPRRTRAAPRRATVVGRHAADVGRLAAAVTAVLDPGLIVLGGSTGAYPQLLPGVRAELERLSWPTEVVSSTARRSRYRRGRRPARGRPRSPNRDRGRAGEGLTASDSVCQCPDKRFLSRPGRRHRVSIPPVREVRQPHEGVLVRRRPSWPGISPVKATRPGEAAPPESEALLQNAPVPPRPAPCSVRYDEKGSKMTTVGVRRSSRLGRGGMRRLVPLAAVAAAGALLLSACGGRDPARAEPPSR